ncbi:hypothetical protein [Streptococcus catagoni]|uniref:hypothetical protein n=1 Tax=Streptococcus catagoni TaxID=2654874 RepID=UPI00140C9FAD|nr:hypothetical protein [Streptococcus catagoni]
MVSYEKVRQSLRTLNIVIIVLNAILAVLSIIGLVSIALVMNNEEAKAALDSATMASLEQLMTPFSIFISALSLSLTIAILVTTVMNQSKIKTKQEISYLPYYLGFALVTVNIITQLLSAPNIIGIAIQLAFLALYYFPYSKAKILNNKEEDLEV